MHLSIDHSIPARAHIAAWNIHNLMVPALVALRLDVITPGAPYEALVSLVEQASRDRPVALTLESLADVTRLETDTMAPEIVRSRLVTKVMARAAVLDALRPGGLPLVPPATPSGRSNLVRKLERGGIGPTAIHNAQRLRAVWSGVEARYRADLPGSNSEIEDIRTRVLDLVAEAENLVFQHGFTEPYGPEMMTRIRELVRVDRLGRVPAVPIEDRHLLGLVYQLTDECDVWWSGEFDLEAAV
jgi:hypothetical protein